MSRRWWIFFAIALVVLVLDQGTKFWAVSDLTRIFELEQASTLGDRLATWISAEKLERLRARPVVVLADYWRFKYVENPGAAWGILGSLPDGLRIPFFFATSVVAIALILFFFARMPPGHRLVEIALALVLGGALGNFADRLLRGYVIDFIDFHWKNDPRLHFPTFNVADVGISVGVALLLSHSFFGRRRPHPVAEPEGRVEEEAPCAATMAIVAADPLSHDRADGPADEEPPGNRVAAGTGSEEAGFGGPELKE